MFAAQPMFRAVVAGPLVLALCSLLLARPAGSQDSGLYAGVQRSTLDSGLQVWSLERPRSETVALRVAVRVGFVDETAEDYGLAHFLEHWMFTDTAAHSENEVKALVSDLGGRWNGYTHVDRTVYQVDLPAARVEEGVAWLGEILGSCRFRPDLEDRVRREVREEYRNTYVVLPPALAGLRSWTGWGTSADRGSELLFPGSTAVLRSTRLGPVLDGLGAGAAQALWRRAYVAGNMALVGVGRVDHVTLVDLARRHFQGLPSGPVPAFEHRVPPARAGRRLELRESLPCLTDERGFALVLRTGGREDTGRIAEFLALRLLRNRLEADLVYRRALVEAVPLFFLEAARLGVAILYSLHDAERHEAVRSAFAAQSADLAQAGPRPEELEQARAELAGGAIRGTEENPDMAEALVELYAALPAGGALPDPLADLRALDRGAVAAAAAKLLGLENQLWLIWDPAFSAIHAGLALCAFVGLCLALARLRKWRRGRARRLASYALAALAALAAGPGLASAEAQGLRVETASLPGGPEIWLYRKPDSPTIALELLARSGSRDEPDDLPGAAGLLLEVLVTGTDTMDEEQVRTGVERLGGSWWCWGDKEAAHLGLHLRAENLAEGLAWLGAVAGRPALAADKLEARRRLAIQARRWDAPLELAGFGGRLNRLLEQRVYSGCGLDRDGRGTPESLAALDPAQLRRLHARTFRRGGTTLVVVGPVGLEELVRLVSQELAGLPEGPAPAPRQTCPPLKAGAEPTLVVDRRPRLTSRGSVIVGHATAGTADPDRWALAVARVILSKSIFETLRNHLGLVYGARAIHEVYSDRGLFYLSAEGEAASRPVMVQAMKAALSGLADTVEPGEVEKAKERLRGAWIRRRDSTRGMLGTLAALAAQQPVGQDPPDPVSAIDAVDADAVRLAMSRLKSMPLFIAYPEPVLTAQGLLFGLAAALTLGLGYWVWRRRRRQRVQQSPVRR